MHERLPDFDLYDALEVSPRASRQTIEAAYRSMAKRYHPDVGDRDLEHIKRLNIARDWLTEPRLRQIYDSSRVAATPSYRPTGQRSPRDARGPAQPPTDSGSKGAPFGPVATTATAPFIGLLTNRGLITGAMIVAIMVLATSRGLTPERSPTAAAEATPSATLQPTDGPVVIVLPTAPPEPTPAPTSAPTPRPTPAGKANLTFVGRLVGKTSKLLLIDCQLAPASIYDTSIHLAAVVKLGERYIGLELEDYLQMGQFIGGHLSDLGSDPPDWIDTGLWSPVAAWYDTDGIVRRVGKVVTFQRTVFTSSTDEAIVITTISGSIACA